MEYASVRLIHISCAVISVSLFTLRGVWQLRGGDWRRWRWLRVAPHLNDTMLLSAALALVLMSGQYPVAQSWLSAKVLALLLYVGLGGVALNPRARRSTRLAAFAAALFCVTYILWVARTRSPTLGLMF